MSRGRLTVFALTLCALAFAALPAFASARTAYFTAVEEGGGYAAPVDLDSGAVGLPTFMSTEGPPRDVAITPDGSVALVSGLSDELVRIDVATNTELPSISMSTGEAGAIAIAPNGAHAYTANTFEETVSVLDLASGAEVGTPIPVGEFPAGIAVTPDGSRAYVSNQGEGTVSVIDLASGTVIDTITVGSEPTGVAVTPDGGRVYVANMGDETVSQIDVATGAATTIPVGVHGREIVVSPDGSHAYVLSPEEGVVPIDLASGTAGAAVSLSAFAFYEDIAIVPDGSRAYITDNAEEGQSFVGRLTPFDLGTNSFGAGFEIGEDVNALAIVPNQPPHAAFSASPESSSVGSSVSFDASGSTDPDGTVARYDWDFGDGTTAANAGPAPSHSYSHAGTYQVTLTTTDNEGCSTEIVFTGQTAYCNGSGVARVTHTVTIAGGKCPKIHGHAGTFTPKIRPAHVVPGVRVRLAVSEPARLVVQSTLIWSKHGEHGTRGLGKLSVNVRRWRRIRLPIPRSLRGLLTLGTRVKVKVRIEAFPRHGSGCASTVTHRTLHVRVVKVIPNAVQAKRPR